MRKLSAVFVLAALMTVPGAVFAHGGKPHNKVMGTVTAIDATHIQVKTTKGTSVSVPLAANTMFMRGDAMAKASDVTSGTRVVIEKSADGKAEHVKMAAPKKMK